jgi:hypothetical protein
MMRGLKRAMQWAVWLGVAVLTCCHSGEKQVIPVDFILPSPPPVAPISHWTTNPLRQTESLEVNGATLRGWTFRSNSSTPQKLCILFFNGNAMNIDESQGIYRQIAVRGGDVTVFDYRGYGFSTGKAHVMDFRVDALAEYDKLAASGPVAVFGFSLGTAMASYVASQRHPAAVILAGTIASADEEFPVFARAAGLSASSIARSMPSTDAGNAFNEAGMMARSDAPLLMLHGEADQLVPIREGRYVFAASPSKRKTFVSVPGAGHNETLDSAVAMKSLREFLNAVSE